MGKYKDVMVLPKMSGKLTVEQIEKIQGQLRDLRKLMGGEEQLYIEGEFYGDAAEHRKGQVAAAFFSKYQNEWAALGGGGRGSSVYFPNGQSVGTHTYDDTYNDDRKYYRQIYFNQDTKGGAPLITDPEFVPWFLAKEINKPPALIPGKLWDPIAFLLEEGHLDPSQWRSSDGGKTFRSGKQAYFFKVKAAEALDDWLKKAGRIKGVKVKTAKINNARKINPATGKPFISSVRLSFNFNHPITGEMLLFFDLNVTFDGMTLGFSPSKEWKMASDLRYLAAHRIARRYVQAQDQLRVKRAAEVDVVNTLLELLNTTPGSYMLSSMAMEGGEMEGAKVGDLQRAAEALQLQGLIGYDGANMVQTKQNIRD